MRNQNILNTEIEKIELNKLKDEIEYQNDTIIIKMLPKKDGNKQILFAIDKEQGLFEHSAAINATVYIIEGEIIFCIEGIENKLKSGSIIELPSNTSHSFTALKKTKMLLIVK